MQRYNFIIAMDEEEIRNLLFDVSELDSDFSITDDPDYENNSSTSSDDSVELEEVRDEPMETDEDNNDDEASNNDVTQIINEVVWDNVKGNLKNFNFTGLTGITQDAIDSLDSSENSLDFFLLFMDDEVLDLIVMETNRYAEQCIIDCITNENVSDSMRLMKWVDTDKEEIKKFVGLIIWMGLDKKPAMKDYWSQSILYNSLANKTMPRNRFELLLNMIHFSDNLNIDGTDKLYKISPLVKLLNQKFSKMYNPEENVCLDETMVPFRGRLRFKQYIPGKRHKYGVKLFKICTSGGYTWNVKVYAGKEDARDGQPVSSKIVMEMMSPLLKSGRTLVTDNFYTSMDLAQKLLDNDIYTIGTLRKNRRGIPRPIVQKKLKRGELISLESDNHIIIGKWKSKRDVLFLTTKSVPVMTELATKRGVISKPSTIVEYNATKSYIDVSDQIASYGSTIRKSVKWYRKVAFELLTNTAVVNAFILRKHVTKSKNSITQLREAISLELMGCNKTPSKDPGPTTKHQLVDAGKRNRCGSCYNALTDRFGRAHAVKHSKQVTTKCSGCGEFKYMCLDCFFSLHTSKRN